MFKLKVYLSEYGTPLKVTDTASRRAILEDIGRAHQERLLREFPAFLVWSCKGRGREGCYFLVCGADDPVAPEELLVELFSCCVAGQPPRFVRCTEPLERGARGRQEPPPPLSEGGR